MDQHHPATRARTLVRQDSHRGEYFSDTQHAHIEHERRTKLVASIRKLLRDAVSQRLSDAAVLGFGALCGSDAKEASEKATSSVAWRDEFKVCIL